MNGCGDPLTPPWDEPFCWHENLSAEQWDFDEWFQALIEQEDAGALLARDEEVPGGL